MADTRDDDRWDVLVERYLEGRLFPSERAALRKRLAADPALRDRLVEAVVQEAALRAIHPREGAAAPEAEASGIVRAAAARRILRAAAWVASVAAAALLVAGAFVWLDRPPEPVACLVRVAGDVVVRAPGGGTSPAGPGLELLPGEGVETLGGNGSASLVCRDGTRLELGEATRADGLASPAGGALEVGLVQGRLAADVSARPASSPLVVVTPHARAEVRGTRFALWVTAEATRLEVLEGRVRIARRSDGEAVDVPAGRFVVAGAEAAGRLAAREIAPPYDYYEALLNPSFEEDADGDGRPDHWSNPRVRRDAERVKDGAAALRAEGPDAPGAYTRQFFRLRPGARYRVTAWLRTHGIAAGANRGVRLRFVQLQPAPAELAVSPWRDGTRDWERVAIEFVTPADHRYGRLDIQWTLGEGEVFWADGATLERID